MSTSETLSDRIKMRMKVLNLTQEELAVKMFITRSAITHYLAGRRVPPLRQIMRLASILKVNAAWLQFGSTLEAEASMNPPKTKDDMPTLYRIPILSWDHTAELLDIKKLNLEKVKDWVPYFYTDQIDNYALQIKNDAMAAPSGHAESFHEGLYIIIDPRKKAQHNDFVIALLPNAKEVTFKQYVIDAGVRYLKPLNPQYPLVAIDDKTHICGVLVHYIGG